MARRGRIEFLERGNYRQRRLRDGARMLPLFAAILMLLPLMWPREEADQSLTSSGILYLFGLWVICVLIAFVLSHLLQYGGGDEDEQQGKAP